jgi:predicted transcriptional regulator
MHHGGDKPMANVSINDLRIINRVHELIKLGMITKKGNNMILTEKGFAVLSAECEPPIVNPKKALPPKEAA